MSTQKADTVPSKDSNTLQAKASHTPGPWKLETVRTSVGVCHQIGPLGASTKLHSACLYDDCYSDKPRDLQLLADAHLISAAPELIEALKAMLLSFYENEEGLCLECGESLGTGAGCESCHVWEKANQAIAKAEGQCGEHLLRARNQTTVVHRMQKTFPQGEDASS